MVCNHIYVSEDQAKGWSRVKADQVTDVWSGEKAAASSAYGHQFLREIVCHTLSGVLEPKVAAAALVKVVTHTENVWPAAGQALVSAVWQVAFHVEAAELRNGDAAHESQAWERLVALVVALPRAGFSLNLLRETLSLQLLSDAKLLKAWGGMAGFKKRTVRANTRLLYTQAKFNLLREESEGYAKLFTELMLDGTTVAGLQRRVHAIVGYFHLDPNRVLALAVEALEHSPNSAPLLALIREFHSSKLTHIVGFKYQACAGSLFPRSLSRVSATLVTAGLLELEPLLGHLDSLPAGKGAGSAGAGAGAGASASATGDGDSDEDMPGDGAGTFAKAVAAVKAATAAFFVLKLGGDSSKDAGTAAPVSNSKKGNNDPDPSHTELSGTWGLESNPSTAMLAAARSQTMGLLVALLERKAWTHAQRLISILSGHGIDVAAWPNVGKALCRLCHHALARSYAESGAAIRVGGKKEESGDACRDPASACHEEGVLGSPAGVTASLVAARPILAVLGPHLSNDPVLFTMLCRLLHHAWKLESDEGRTRRAIRTVAFGILKRYMLPSMTLLGSRAAIANEMWKVLSELGWTQRYSLYSQWLLDVYDGHYLTRLARGRVRLPPPPPPLRVFFISFACIHPSLMVVRWCHHLRPLSRHAKR